MIFQPLKIPNEKAAEVVKSYQERVNGCPVILLHEKVTDNADGLYNPILDVACLMSPSLSPANADTDHLLRVLFHELAHSTGIPARLNRPGVFAMSHDENQPAYYAYEEIVAERCSAIVLGVLGLRTERTKMESERYVQRYLNILPPSQREDVSRQAESRARDAAELILDKKLARKAA